MRYTAIIAAMLLAGCTPEMTVHHNIEPIQVEPVAPVVESPAPVVAEEPVAVEWLENGLYELTDWTIVHQGYTFDADSAMTLMPFNSYRGELLLLDGVAEFTFTGLIGATVIEQRSSTWHYEGVEFTDDGVVQIYYANGQLQIQDETRESVDRITYTFMILQGDA